MFSVANIVHSGVKWRSLSRHRDPALYEDTREVCERHFREIFPTLSTTLKWKQKGFILDHGSGVGSTTFEFILPLAEISDSNIIGLDNDDSLLEHARVKYPSSRIKHVHGEITSPESPVKGLRFDTIFSLYTLHLVDDYKAELKAMHELLTDDGELFMIIVVNTPLFGVHAKLLKTEPWREAAQRHLVLPEWLHNSENEDDEIKTAFTNAGLAIQDWKREERMHEYRSLSRWSDFAFSLNSFAKELPPDKYDELRELYLTYFRETETKTYKPSEGKSTYILHYEVITVLAKRQK